MIAPCTTCLPRIPPERPRLRSGAGWRSTMGPCNGPTAAPPVLRPLRNLEVALDNDDEPRVLEEATITDTTTSTCPLYRAQRPRLPKAQASRCDAPSRIQNRVKGEDAGWNGRAKGGPLRPCCRKLHSSPRPPRPPSSLGGSTHGPGPRGDGLREGVGRADGRREERPRVKVRAPTSETASSTRPRGRRRPSSGSCVRIFDQRPQPERWGRSASARVAPSI
jgi:hypothetical protein